MGATTVILKMGDQGARSIGSGKQNSGPCIRGGRRRHDRLRRCLRRWIHVDDRDGLGDRSGSSFRGCVRQPRRHRTRLRCRHRRLRLHSGVHGDVRNNSPGRLTLRVERKRDGRYCLPATTARPAAGPALRPTDRQALGVPAFHHAVRSDVGAPGVRVRSRRRPAAPLSAGAGERCCEWRSAPHKEPLIVGPALCRPWPPTLGVQPNR